MVEQGFESAYFGFTDSVIEGEWKWVSCDKCSNSVYVNWHSGEPNSENSSEDYAEFYWKFKDGTWNDGDFGVNTASDREVFICEWDFSN
jgi:hypothetical protein